MNIFMTKKEIYRYYFNPIIENILTNTQLELDYINEEFKLWLIENEFIDIALNESDTSSVWYANQKSHIINNINVAVNNMTQFVKEQSRKNFEKLNSYKEIVLNNRMYPVKPEAIPETSTNYKLALQRIDTPVTKNLTGIDLNKIDSEEGQDKNIWLKNYLVPIYKGGNFLQIAKNYYYGLDNNQQIKMNPKLMSETLISAYKFCSLITNRMQSFSVEGRTLINFINKDPNTGQVNQGTISDLQKIKMATQKNALTDKAGTNPYKNIGQNPVKPLNANTDYEIFEYEYFSDILTEKQAQIDSSTPRYNNLTKPQSPIITKDQNNNLQNSSSSSPQQQQFQKQNPNGAVINSGSLAYRKKQVMCEIIKDCFNAKLSAIGLLYRDFMYLMEQHVNSYKTKSNNNQQQKDNSKQNETNSNQQQNQTK